MHICIDEVLAFLALTPWIGAGFLWLKTKRRQWLERKQSR
jgi:hypothetical protein